MNQEISKKIFWRYVNKKINRSIHHYHVFSVISILFEELINDLINDKEIKIFNFVKLKLSRPRAKRYFNVVSRCMQESSGNRLLKFSLSPKLKKRLVQSLDVDKTFPNN